MLFSSKIELNKGSTLFSIFLSSYEFDFSDPSFVFSEI